MNFNITPIEHPANIIHEKIKTIMNFTCLKINEVLQDYLIQYAGERVTPLLMHTIQDEVYKILYNTPFRTPKITFDYRANQLKVEPVRFNGVDAPQNLKFFYSFNYPNENSLPLQS